MDLKKLTLFTKIVEEYLDIRPLMQLKGECEKCQRPFRHPISSIAGLRNIFFVHDIDEEFS